MCGEQIQITITEKRENGSPPRVRGTVILTPGRLTEFRITPACAGNSYQFLVSYSASKDHPRVCGEQNVGISVWMRQKGSPPRVRGTEYYLSARACAGRITPACAGNRAPKSASFALK